MTPASKLMREAARQLGPEHGRLSADLIDAANKIDRDATELRIRANACDSLFAQDAVEQGRNLGTLISYANLTADAISGNPVTVHIAVHGCPEAAEFLASLASASRSSALRQVSVT